MPTTPLRTNYIAVLLIDGGPVDIELAGNVLNAASTALKLADRAVEELHAAVDIAGVELQDLLRHGLRNVSLIISATVGLWAPLGVAFRSRELLLVWPSPFAQAAAEGRESGPASHAVRVRARCEADWASSESPTRS